MKKRLSKL